MNKKAKDKFKTYSKWIGIILGTASCLTLVVKGFSAVDNRYAKSQNVAQMADMIQKVSERLDYEILTDQIESKQERIWALEDRFIKTKEKALQDEIISRTEHQDI